MLRILTGLVALGLLAMPARAADYGNYGYGESYTGMPYCAHHHCLPVCDEPKVLAKVTNKFAFYDANIIRQRAHHRQYRRHPRNQGQRQRPEPDPAPLLPRHRDALQRQALRAGLSDRVPGRLRLDPLGCAVLPARLRPLPGLRRLVPFHPSVRLVSLLAAFLLVAAPAFGRRKARRFDFYVLSLSWSPTYCATNSRPDPAECDTPRGFIVHGLWPQYERGYPSDCPSNMPRRVSQATVDGLSDIMPGGGLVNHEWQKHGVCSGLNQVDLLRHAPPRLRGGRAADVAGRPHAGTARDRAGLHRRQSAHGRDRHRRPVQSRPHAGSAHLPDQDPRLPPLP